MITPLADIWQAFTNDTIGAIVLGLIGALTMFVLSAQAIIGYRGAFGRKPPFDDELARHNATIEQIKKNLANLAPNEKLEALINRLGSFATLTQLAEVKLDSEQSVKDVRAYSHAEAHNTRNDLGARIMELESAQISRWERLAAIEADVKTLNRTVGGFDGKLDRLIERTGELRGAANNQAHQHNT